MKHKNRTIKKSGNTDVSEFPRPLNMMKRGYQIPTPNCPNCKKELDRYAIWVETYL